MGVPVGHPAEGKIIIRDRLALSVATVLITAAAVSWAATYYLSSPTAGPGSAMGLSAIVGSLSLPSFGSFELVWVVGMAAMMFPAMIPVVQFYDKVLARAEPDPRLARVVGTPLFLGGYLIAYAGLGLVIYLAVLISIGPLSNVSWLSALSFLGPSLVLFTAGIYQLTGLKSKALSACISPIGFFSTKLRRGLVGSGRMGFSHGLYCVGCCWAYMLVMLAVALMSIPFMALLAGLVTLEKLIIKGANWFRYGVSAGFVLLGVVQLFFPGILALI